MQIDLPEVVTEVREAFAAYERALIAGDADALDAFFWRDPPTLRYGTADAQYSHPEIAAFRRRPGAKSPPRSLHRTRITTFGRDLAWVRMPQGWKIVSAHVSFACEG
jgi:hypothetical protein